MKRENENRKPLPELDLHRHSWANAGRVLRRELHAARVRGEAGLVAITGLGWATRLAISGSPSLLD